MAFNGAGTFVRLFNWVNDALNNIDITASREDAEDDGFAAGLTNCLTRDGQGTPTSPLVWNTRLTLAGGMSVAQPAFNVQLSNFNTLPSGTDNVVLDQVNVNAGNGYSNGTGVFTAPAAGLYLFSASLILQNNSGVSVVFNTAYFSKNNGSTLGPNTYFLGGISPNSVLAPSPSNFPLACGASVVLLLGLNDTVSLKVSLTGGSLQATNLSYFCGYQLG